MLLSLPFYETFTAKKIADAKATSGVLLCLTFDDKAGVDAIHHSAVSSGGLETRAIEDKGFMYGGAFDDPDGHGWETVWMDPAAVDGGVPDAKIPLLARQSQGQKNAGAVNPCLMLLNDPATGAADFGTNVRHLRAVAAGAVGRHRINRATGLQARHR